MRQIDSGPKGIVCGVNKNGLIYCRVKITATRKYGYGWRRVPGRLRYITCGEYGNWGVNRAKHIYFRLGVSRSRPEGMRWKRIRGPKLVRIEAGQYGQVWGVDTRGIMYVRRGVREKRPFGTSWKRIKSRTKWRRVSIGIGAVYGVDRKGFAYRGPLSIGGKQPFQSDTLLKELKKYITFTNVCACVKGNIYLLFLELLEVYIHFFSSCLMRFTFI